MKIGFITAGGIARILADTMRQMDSVELYAVAARDLSRAEAFAKEFGFTKAYGSYEEMVKDPEVELVYIASPHSHHYEHAMLCIEHGKPVLCEKAFTLNAGQAKKLLAYAKEKKVMITEAIWTRYMPTRKMIDDVIKSGVIGEPVTLTANLGYNVAHVARLVDPNLAGGALLDVGVYPLNFALMVFGHDFETIVSSAVMTERGVDSSNSFTLTYPDGRMAILNSTFRAVSDRKGIIYGTKGYMIIENINNPERIFVYEDDRSPDRKPVAVYERPAQISGYEYEVQAAIDAVKAGKLECDEMPHEETIRVMEIMDSIRADWDLVYPMEK